MTTNFRGAWLWIPALWLTALAWNSGPISFSPYLLAIPLAALLGARYGYRALWLAAIGGLPLLPPSMSYGWLTKVAALDVYVVAIAACVLAAQGRPLAERLPRIPRPAVLAAALVVLPTAFTVWGTDFLGIRFGFSFVATFYFLLFLLGWSGFPVRWTIAALALGTVAGMWLETVVPPDGRALFGGPEAELPLFGPTRLHLLSWDYRLDTPAAFLTGLAYFGAGRLWAAMLRTRTPPLASPYAYALVLGLVALALGSVLNSELLAAVGLEPRAPPRYALVLGSPLALPLAGLAGGLLLGKRGAVAAVAAVAFFWALTALLLLYFRAPSQAWSIAAHEPLVAAGFGLLGARLRELALGIEAAWPVRRWVLAGALCVLAAGFVAEAQSIIDLVLRLLGIAAVGAAALLARWLRARLGVMLKLNFEAWMAVLAVALFAVLLAGQAAALAGMARRLSQDGLAELWEDIYRGRDEAVVVAGAFALLGIVAYALEVLLKNAPVVLSDIFSWFRVTPLPRFASSALWPRLAGGARWVRIGAFAAAVLPLLATTAYELYPKEGILASVRGLFQETREAPARPGELARSEPKTTANPQLWQAALEAVAGFPLVESDPARGRLLTGWKSDPGAPDVRTRMTLRVGTELKSYALDVKLVRQKRGPLGIWVQQEKYWDATARKFVGFDTWPERQRIATEILARAVALEKKD